MAIATRFAIDESQAGAAPETGLRPHVGPGHRELLDKILLACGGNVEASLHHPRELKPIRALIRAGYDLEREILPVLGGVRAMTNRLRTFRGAWIQREMDEARVAAAEAERG